MPLPLAARPWGPIKPPCGAPASPAHPTYRGLATAWPLLERGGAPADLLRPWAKATLTGGPTWTTDGLKFVAASSQQAQLPAASVPSFGSAAWTVAALVRWTDAGTTVQVPLGFYTSGTATPIVQLEVNHGLAGQVSVTVRDPAASIIEVDSPGTTYNDGRPHLIVATSDKAGGTTTLYADGIPVGTATTPASGLAINLGYFGARNVAGTFSGYFNGTVLGAWCWAGRCLSAADVKAWAADPFGMHAAAGRLWDLFAPTVTAFVGAASGGLVLGGTAAPAVTYRPPASGGIDLGGSAAPGTAFAPAGSGGPILGGAAAPGVAFLPPAAGGVLLSGAAAPGVTFAPIAAGGLVLGGVATLTLAETLFAAGGVILGSTAAPAVAFAPAGSGGPILGGTTSPGATFPAAGSGGATLGGVAIAAATFPVSAIGGVILGGTAQPTSNNQFTATASGGAALGGSAGPSAAFPLVAAGGLDLGGTATPAVAFAPSAAGGVLLGGTAAPTVAFAGVPAGGPELGGSASLRVDATPFAAGGVALGGHAQPAIVGSNIPTFLVGSATLAAGQVDPSRVTVALAAGQADPSRATVANA